MTKNCFIFDLDGTLADDSHRVHLLANGQWDEYFARCPNDKAIEHIVQVANALSAFDFAIAIVTGRSETVREETLAWLGRALEYPVDELIMRGKDDRRPNSEMKLAALTDLRGKGYEVLMAFDDQPQTCAMWRNAGVPCAQVKGTDEFVEYRRQA